MIEEMNKRIKQITPTISYNIQVCCHLVPEIEERTFSKSLKPHEFCQIVRDHLSIRRAMLSLEFGLCSLPHRFYVVCCYTSDRVDKI